MDTPNMRKIEVGSEGLGLVDASMVEQRATELALMDGRDSFNDRDLEQARLELVGHESVPPPPEASDPISENLTSWDEVPAASGAQIPTRGPEDEATLAETLVEEGLEEADHDTRVAASHEAPPEEL